MEKSILKTELKILHLCNENTPEYSRWQNITTKNKLAELNEKENEIIWLVNAHLSWDGNDLNNDYGFEMATYLRLVKKSKAPIIIYSPENRSIFERKSKKVTKYLILFGRGSSFLEVPFTEDIFNEQVVSMFPLSNASLHDVSIMLCNLKGIIVDRLNHDLKFENNPLSIDTVIDNISPYLSEYHKKLIELNEFSKKLKDKISAMDDEGYFIVKQQLLNLCNLHLHAGTSDREPRSVNNFKVLLLEDNKEELNEFCTNLEKHFEIIPTATAEKARTIIEQDIDNNILAVISDWRLYEDEKKTYWQNLQGYEVLELAANSGLRALFALTSQADFVVHQIRNLMGVKFSMFKKENLRTPDQWKLFTDILLEQCKEVIEVRASLPCSKNWKKDINKNGKTIKSLHQQYLEVWNSDKREVYFKRIDEKAAEILDYLNRSGKNNYKDLKALNAEFGIQLPTTDLKLEPVLIFRRIWMAIWFNIPDADRKLSQESISLRSEKIYEMMFAPGYKGEKAVSANQTAYKLCLEISEVQKRMMLPEEKAWLTRNDLI